jgi:MinD-like ATPase involved in chromosome partitioning or flagellar assembly
MLGNKSGRIITFYSYKGGTGRTMAAANLAWILASNGYKILLIDWDLESPGLHRYLRPFLADPDLTSTPGLIDFACDAARAKNIAVERSEFPSLMDYTVALNWSFTAAGSIDFLAAGRQDKDYQWRVNTFNWRDFYERQGGDHLFGTMRNKLKENYDYVLIDSRTGVGDTSGICTVQVPDLLVVLFTLNHQSIEGAAAMAASIHAKRAGLPIFPVPTRIEHGEQDRLSAATAFARRMFAPFLLHVQSDRRAVDLKEQASYWRDVETPYIAYYAFEEIPAAFKDEPGNPRGLLAASERLSSWITDRTVSSLKLGNSERRSAVLEAFAFDRDRAARFDWAAPARKSWLYGELEAIGLRFGRYRWQVATMVFAGTALVMAFYPRPADNPTLQLNLTSQLDEAMKDLSSVQAFASDPSEFANFPKSEFAKGFAILQGVLAQLKSSRQTSPRSVRQGGVAESSSPKRQHSAPEPSPHQ